MTAQQIPVRMWYPVPADPPHSLPFIPAKIQVIIFQPPEAREGRPAPSSGWLRDIEDWGSPVAKAQQAHTTYFLTAGLGTASCQ